MSPVEVLRDGAVLIVRLAVPERRNVLDLPTARALGDAVEGRGDARAIVLLAAGDHFCVGGDVRAMAAATDRAAMVRGLADEFHRTLLALEDAPPLVVGQRGWAAGAGMSLVLASDVAVAGTSARLQPAYPGIGVTPDGGMSWTLPRAVGARRARSILLRNTVLTADEAQALGVVDEVVADGDVDARAIAVATELAAGPTGAYAGAKRLLRASASASLAEQLDAEAASIAACAAGPEGTEGITAFAAKRRPTFAD